MSNEKFIAPRRSEPVNPAHAIARLIIAHACRVHGTLEGRAAQTSFADATTRRDLDFRQRYDRRQDDHTFGRGTGDRNGEQSKRITGAERRRSERVRAALRTRAVHNPAIFRIHANRRHLTRVITWERRVIEHLDPKRGNPAFVDQGESLFQAIADLRPAESHLAYQRQAARE